MPELLLHICCGPCAIMPVQRLRELGYTITGLFFNPNIQPLKEYMLRRETALRCAEHLGFPLICVDEDSEEGWDLVQWLRSMSGNEAPDNRCPLCLEQRIAYTAQRAEEKACAFSSSLLYSRWQRHEAIKAFGERSPLFVYQDFRKDWQEGIRLSKEWGFYRQQYCGCVFSEAERYQKEFEIVRGTTSNSR